MTKIIVDGKELETDPGNTIMQACHEAGVEIPHFCYHERLSIAGNCRMCLVEVKGGPPKPTASCAMRIRDLRPGPNGEPPEISTKSEMVKKAREGVMEFLLINHPLDCPICDQGGECQLQDQSLAFGVDKNRFHENKRAVEDKYIGPVVRTKMTRCIHCTRCVRFTQEVAGVEELGQTGRGENAEITSYLQSAMTSELQGNVIDLCPVGALTSRPFQDTARPWELTKTNSVDVMDAVGCPIRLDSRDNQVLRVLPRTNDAINEEWISDKTRFVADGIRSQRLDKPYVRSGGKLKPCDWTRAFNAVAKKIKDTDAKRIGAIAGDLCGVEEVYALKKLMEKLGAASMDCREAGSALDPARGRAGYLFNPTIEGIDESDALLIIGSNPRIEAAVLNARIRKRSLKGDYPIGVIGEAAELRYDHEHLGETSSVLEELVSGKNKFAAKLKKAKKPIILVGQGALSSKDGEAVLSLAAKLAVDVKATSGEWNGFGVLHTAAARAGALDVGFVPGQGGMDTAAIASGAEVVILLGADEVEINNDKAFVVYIGSHGDRGAHRADVILPAACFTEKSSTTVNTEGRVLRGNRSVVAPGMAKEDWSIIRALSGVLGLELPFNSLAQLRMALESDYPHFASLNEVVAADAAGISTLAGGKAKLSGVRLASTVDDFYFTNPVARASQIMAECSAAVAGGMKQAAE